MIKKVLVIDITMVKSEWNNDPYREEGVII